MEQKLFDENGKYNFYIKAAKSCMDNADWTEHFKNKMQVMLNDKSLNTGSEQVLLIFE